MCDCEQLFKEFIKENIQNSFVKFVKQLFSGNGKGDLRADIKAKRLIFYRL